MKSKDEYGKIIKEKLFSLGVSDCGFARIDVLERYLYPDLPIAVSIVVKLSDAVVDEIGDVPTFPYFHHYRTVNAYIDSVLLQTGMLIESLGFRYIPVAASQSIPSAGAYTGLVSHKAAARLAGLGSIGKSALFISKKYGPRVRLGTILTDMPLPTAEAAENVDVCGACNLCVRACPALALTGRVWQEGMPRSEIIDAEACSSYMKAHFQHIGRGAVCGICMRVCRHSRQKP